MSEQEDRQGTRPEDDPEVVPKATRRKFTAQFKLRTLQKLDELQGSGQIGAYLRSEGLYAAQVSNWRKAFDEGGLDALEPRKRGRKNLSEDELEQRARDAELERLRKQNERLERKLAQAEAIIEIQKKVADFLGTLETGSDS